MNVKVIRISSGEDVVADVLEDKEDSLVLMNPIVAVPTGLSLIHISEPTRPY